MPIFGYPEGVKGYVSWCLEAGSKKKEMCAC